MSDVITDNLALWTSALLTKSTAGRGSTGKLEAYGIKKLRELILELAVRGKLVPQDPKDEPAKELLKTIAAKKAQMVMEGKVKKERPLPEIAEDEKNYELPSGWEFVRLGDVAFSQAGFAFKSNFFNENSDGLPLIRIRDVGQPFTGTYYSGEYREEFLIEKGDYLISMDGEFRVSPWTNGPALLNQRVSRLIFYYEKVGQRFIADSLQARLRELQGVKAYTTVDHLSGTQITEAVIGLPPLAEQHRIVAKVDELMALCDQLEQQQTQSIEAHKTLVEALLGTLTRFASQQEFRAAWARIASHFDTLFTTEASIDQLKQTILQLAVMGKLVPQDPNDEPATELLKRIDGEKRQLIEVGQIREKNAATPISKEERPFNVPTNWAWARLSEITRRIHYGYTASARPEIEGVRLLRITDIQDNTVDWQSVPGCEIEDRDLPQYQLDLGDILVARTGGTVGKTYLVSAMPVAAVFASYLIRIQGASALFVRYLKLFLESPTYWEQLVEGARGGAQPNVNGQTLGKMVVPVPPQGEQRRIVAKVDELMALCDALKARLADAQATQLSLADAVVEQALT